MSLLATISTVAVASYALLSSVHKSAQALYALRTDASLPPYDPVDTGALPSVDVIVPCFNEDPRTLAACLKSLASQDYPGRLQVYVVDDGSANAAAVAPVHGSYAYDPRFNVILLPSNVGKRKAQIAAIRRSFGDLVLNVDSDTEIASDVVSKLVRKMQDPAIGAAMGQLTASNRNDSWLTRLIDMEYWLACNEERAAQTRFGAVMCCCGPCAMYRRSALLLLLDQYETQFFRGKPSDFGEDRHLTILMLKAGFRTEYVPDAIAATVVPDRLLPYLRQQLRWARSTYRDTLLGLHLLPGLDRYLTLDVLGQNLGPLLLAISSIAALAQLALTGTVPWWTGLTIVAMTMIRCSVAALRAGELRFIGFSLHTPINIFLLLPMKAYALCTLSNSDWLSRRPADLPDGNGTDGKLLCPGPTTDEPKEIVCTSRIEHLEHRIALQLEAVAQLICQDKFALRAVKLLDELTSELVAAKLELGAIGEASTSKRTVPTKQYGDLFYPEDLRILANIFDQAVAALPPDHRTIANRTQIAKLVLAQGTTREAKSDPIHGACVLGDLLDQTFNSYSSNQIEVRPSTWRNSA